MACSLRVVAIDLFLGPVGDRFEQAAAVVAELRADLADHLLFILGQAAAIDVFLDRFPGAQILLDHPVDQLIDRDVDLLLGVADDLALELGADLVGVEQVEDAADPDRVLEELVAARSHLADDVLDPGQVIGELAAHILRVELKLPVDRLDRVDVVGKDRQPVVGRLQVSVGQVLGDAERAEQLEPDPALLVERLEDVLLERAEAALPPESLALGRVACRRASFACCASRAEIGEDLRPEAEQPLDVLGHEFDRP